MTNVAESALSDGRPRDRKEGHFSRFFFCTKRHFPVLFPRAPYITSYTVFAQGRGLGRERPKRYRKRRKRTKCRGRVEQKKWRNENTTVRAAYKVYGFVLPKLQLLKDNKESSIKMKRSGKVSQLFKFNVERIALEVQICS